MAPSSRETHSHNYTNYKYIYTHTYTHTHNELYGHFLWIDFNYIKAAEPLQVQRQCLLLITYIQWKKKQMGNLLVVRENAAKFALFKKKKIFLLTKRAVMHIR